MSNRKAFLLVSTLLGREHVLDDPKLRFLRAVLRDNAREAGKQEGDRRPLTLQLAGETANLSRPSVQEYIKMFRRARVILEDRVEIPADIGYVFGVDLRSTHPVRVVLRTAHGQKYGEIWTADSGASLDVSAVDLLNTAEGGIKHLIETHELDLEKLIGIGVSIPGPVVDGQSVGFEGSRWTQIRADNGLSKRLGVPAEKIIVRSDTFASAIIEHLWGAAEAAEPFNIYVKWSVDLRAAITLNGELYLGHKGTAGELGHIQTDVDEAPDSKRYASDEEFEKEEKAKQRRAELLEECRVCHETTCLHAISSLSYLGRLAFPDLRTTHLSAKAIIDFATGTDQDEDSEVTQRREDTRVALKTAARWIARSVATYVAALDPASIVLGGAIGARAFELVEEEFNEEISRVAQLRAPIEIVGAEKEQSTATIGAAACALLELGPGYLLGLASGSPAAQKQRVARPARKRPTAQGRAVEQPRAQAEAA